jgi:hypothetical protein
MALQTANQFQLGTDFSRLGSGVQQGQQIANQFQIGQQNEQKLDATAEESRIMSVVQGASEIVNLPNDTAKLNALYKRKEQLIQQGKTTQDTDEAIGLFESGDSQGANGLIQSVVDMGVQTGRLKAPAGAAPGFTLGNQRFSANGDLIATGQENGGKTGLASAKTEIFDNGTTISVLPSGETQVTNPAGIIVDGEDRTKVLTTARQEQIDFSSKKAAATASGSAEGEASKAGLVAKAKAKIASAVSLATADAKQRGETLTDLSRLNASLPGLLEVVGELKTLAPLATSTIAGNIFDFGVKESGFGSTKGADAKSKFIAIIANQVLPLLKPTFGSAFTVAEGESLKATMGDPDVSPDQKIEQLNAFIEGKQRAIQSAERELGLSVTPLTELSDEDLAAQIQAARSAQGVK